MISSGLLCFYFCLCTNTKVESQTHFSPMGGWRRRRHDRARLYQTELKALLDDLVFPLKEGSAEKTRNWFGFK